MLSKRVMVVAADKALHKRLAAGAMAAGGAVQGFAALDEVAGRVEYDLALVELAPGSTVASLSARLPDGAHLVPILPSPDLAWMTALLADARVPAVLVADQLTAAQVTATVAKLLSRDLFGVEKLLPWGTRVYSALVSDYNEKSAAIAAIGDFAQAMGVRRKYREQIDQCIDEMLMNALYDAPVDDEGKPLFADVPVRERVLMRADEKALVQYGCDGERFTVSVRDAFGTLRKETILWYLDKCLHATSMGGEQIDRKAGGAGLGLYLICNSASEVGFHIFAGSATEVICSFDLSAARAQLRALGIFEERIVDARAPTGEITTIPTRRGRRHEDLAPRAPPPRAGLLLPVMMTFAVLLLVFAVGLAALPYLRRPAAASLRIESDPPGALVYVDGRARGTTPLAVDAEAGRSYAVRAVRPGWRDDEQLVTAAAGDAPVRLHLERLAATLAVETEPAGARVLVDGKETGKLTPATLELPPSSALTLTLRKEGFVESSVKTTAPAPGEHALYHTALALESAAALLTVATDPPSANVTVDGLLLAPPAPSHDTFVAPAARHKVKASAPGFVDARADVTVAGGEHRSLHLALVAGGTLALRLNVAAKVLVDDKPVGTAPLAPLGLTAGEHTLALRGKTPPIDYSTKVSLETGHTLEVRLDFNADHKVTGHIGDRPVADQW
ncbi:MAG TPA: PEGA domain-containing protein [Polyangia bacterium]